MNGAPIVSIPIAICLFFMMYPIMVKIDFGDVVRAGRSVKPVSLTLIINWTIKPFTMFPEFNIASERVCKSLILREAIA